MASLADDEPGGEQQWIVKATVVNNLTALRHAGSTNLVVLEALEQLLARSDDSSYITCSRNQYYEYYGHMATAMEELGEQATTVFYETLQELNRRAKEEADKKDPGAQRILPASALTQAGRAAFAAAESFFQPQRAPNVESERDGEDPTPLRNPRPLLPVDAVALNNLADGDQGVIRGDYLHLAVFESWRKDFPEASDVPFLGFLSEVESIADDLTNLVNWEREKSAEASRVDIKSEEE